MESLLHQTEITLIHPLRANKKLLVLDLDYTLFDMKSTATNLLGMACVTVFYSTPMRLWVLHCSSRYVLMISITNTIVNRAKAAVCG